MKFSKNTTSKRNNVGLSLINLIFNILHRSIILNIFVGCHGQVQGLKSESF